MRIRRKTNQCLNCGYTLDKVYNYCPNCGQENDDNNVSIGTLTSDFFSTYFALDSKFAKTVKPFFIRPGFLTNRYAEGKRASYAHPLRLYLIISIFFFFIFTLVGKKFIKETSNDDTPIVDASYSLKNIDGLDKNTLKQLDSLLSDSTLSAVTENLRGDDLEDFQKAFNKTLSEKQKEEIRSNFNEKSLWLLGLGLDTINQSTATETQVVSDTASRNSKEPVYIKKEKSRFILERLDWKLINDLKHNKEYTDAELLDSMKLGELSSFDKHVAMQGIRVQRADKEQIIEFILKNVPLMMLLLIPLFAAILKLLYIRRNQLYIKHLIHALHLHSFVYFLYGITLLIIVFILEKGPFKDVIAYGSIVLVSVYAYISFLKVYRQHWFKTLIKFFIIGCIYIFFIFIFFTAEMIISMLLY